MKKFEENNEISIISIRIIDNYYIMIKWNAEKSKGTL